MLVQNGQVRFHPFSFFGSIWHGNAAGYRTRKRESVPATISGCCVFPVPKPSCPTFAGPGNGRQDHLKTNAAGRTPASASHVRMAMTLAGLLSRRQESRGFPLVRCAALWIFPVAHRAIPLSFPFPFRLSSRYANVPMPPFQTASVVIFVAGAKVKTGLGTQIF